MKMEEFLKLFADQPIIEPKMIVRSSRELAGLKVQLSRWVKSGKLIKVRRGMYILNKPYSRKNVDADYVATFVHRPSYISLEYALADYGLIPEFVPNLTLITTSRPFKMDFGNRKIIYKYIQTSRFFGYLPRGRKNFETFYAEPEKAILDLFYFTRGKIDADFLKEMRFQNLETLNLNKLTSYAERFNSPKVLRATKLFCRYISEKESEW